MRKFLYLLILIIVVFSLYVLYLYYKSVNSHNVHILSAEEPPVVSLEKDMSAIIKSNWTGSVSQDASSYQYPYNVFSVGLEVKLDSELRTDYTKILVKDLDDYRFFCLNEILRQRRIDFSYYKDNDSFNLVVFVPDKNVRHRILDDFKHYGISYELSFKK